MVAGPGFLGTLRRSASKMKVLCVAEKPSIAKAVASHLSGGTSQVVSLFPALYPGRLANDPSSTIRGTSISKTMSLTTILARAGATAR